MCYLIFFKYNVRKKIIQVESIVSTLQPKTQKLVDDVNDIKLKFTDSRRQFAENGRNVERAERETEAARQMTEGLEQVRRLMP